MKGLTFMHTRLMLLIGAVVVLIAIALMLVPLGEHISVLMPTPVLGIVIDKDMRIVHVEAKGAAERAGIQKGDIVEVLDGTLATTQRELVRQIIQEARAGQQHTIRVKRAGKSVDMLIVPAPPVPNSQATPTPVLPPYDYL